MKVVLWLWLALSEIVYYVWWIWCWCLVPSGLKSVCHIHRKYKTLLIIMSTVAWNLSTFSVILPTGQSFVSTGAVVRGSPLIPNLSSILSDQAQTFHKLFVLRVYPGLPLASYLSSSIRLYHHNTALHMWNGVSHITQLVETVALLFTTEDFDRRLITTGQQLEIVVRQIWSGHLFQGCLN